MPGTVPFPPSYATGFVYIKMQWLSEICSPPASASVTHVGSYIVSYLSADFMMKVRVASFINITLLFRCSFKSTPTLPTSSNTSSSTVGDCLISNRIAWTSAVWNHKTNKYINTSNWLTLSSTQPIHMHYIQ